MSLPSADAFQAFSDRMLRCVDCGARFPFSAAEQRYFAEMEFVEPKRCRPCRYARKREREQ